MGQLPPRVIDFSIAHTRRGTLDSVTASDLVILTCHNMVNMCYVYESSNTENIGFDKKKKKQKNNKKKKTRKPKPREKTKTEENAGLFFSCFFCFFW